MSLRHWVWILIGLLFWAVLAVLWMTSPTHCSVPDEHHVVRCDR